MAFLSREFIAVPDDKKDQILFKWPDINLRKFSRVIVEPDQLALFINRGEVIGTLGPGRHPVDADELPFIGIFIDAATGGNAYRAEMYFVGTREYTGNRFGGRVDNVQDPQTGLIITLRVFGEYALKVLDPAKTVLNLTGTVDVDDNSHITDWVAEQLLKVLRTETTRQIVRNGWPILGLSAYTPDLEAAVITAANTQLADYGLGVTRMGNFDVNLDDEDEDRLKKLAGDTAYTRLAGSFGQYAAGAALLGAGEGAAKGGGANNPIILGAAMGVGQQVPGVLAQPSPPPPPAPGYAGGGPGHAQTPSNLPPPPPSGMASQPAGATAACVSCQTSIPAGAKFCPSCGTAQPQKAFCAQCGTEMPAGAKFCPSCGTPAGGGAQ